MVIFEGKRNHKHRLNLRKKTTFKGFCLSRFLGLSVPWSQRSLWPRNHVIACGRGPGQLPAILRQAPKSLAIAICLRTVKRKSLRLLHRNGCEPARGYRCELCSGGVRVRFHLRFQAAKVSSFGGFGVESPTNKATASKLFYREFLCPSTVWRGSEYG